MQAPSETTIPFRSTSNGRDALVGSGWDASAPLRLKGGKDSKRVNTLETPPANR